MAGGQGNQSLFPQKRNTLPLGDDFWKFLYPNYTLPPENYKLNILETNGTGEAVLRNKHWGIPEWSSG